jgi:hypothetical protein
LWLRNRCEESGNTERLGKLPVLGHDKEIRPALPARQARGGRAAECSPSGLRVVSERKPRGVNGLLSVRPGEMSDGTFRRHL